MQYVYKIDNYKTPGLEDMYHPGDEVLVYSKVYSNEGGKQFFYLSKHLASEGCPGNIDKRFKKFHGWRGEYNHVTTYAHGVYTIKSVEVLPGNYALDRYTKVTLNRKDIRKNEE